MKIIPVLLNIKKLIIILFIILIKKARKYSRPLIIFKILLKDIIKILYLKVIRILMEI